MGQFPRKKGQDNRSLHSSPKTNADVQKNNY